MLCDFEIKIFSLIDFAATTRYERAKKNDEKFVNLPFTPSRFAVNLPILISRALHNIWYYLARLYYL